MPGQLLTLPLRLWARGARLALHVAEDVTERAVTETLRVAGMIGALRPGGQGAPAPSPGFAPSSAAAPRPPSRPTASSPTAAPTPSAEPGPAAAPTRPPRPAPPARPARPRPVGPPPASLGNGAGQGPAEPAHVSEEPVVVREEAEPGAEDGAGASVSIREPWDGYAKLNARDVIDRLGGASAAELAAVQLYETAHRSRQTVLQATERQLKSAGH